MNSKTQSYVAGEYRSYNKITCIRDLDSAKDLMIQNQNLDDEEHWFILNWQPFEEE